MPKDTLQVAIDNVLNKPRRLSTDHLIRKFLECVVDWVDCQVRVQAELEVGDIEIGAVEVKDGTTDTRLKINTDFEALVHDADTHSALASILAALPPGGVHTTATFFALAALPAASTPGVSVLVDTSSQVDLFLSYTKGAEVAMELVVELSDDGITWAELAGESFSGTGPTTVSQSTLSYKFPASGKYRIPVPVNDIEMRVKVKASAGPLPTGTVAVEGVLN